VIEVSARIAALIGGVAGAAGADVPALYAAAGFDPAALADPDARIPLAVEHALWEEAARVTGDPTFGLSAARALRPGAFDVLDYVVRTAPTLGDALARLARYNRLFHDVAEFVIEPRGEIVRLVHRFRDGAPHRHAVEVSLGSIVVVGGQIGGAPIAARAVELRHAPPPGGLDAYVQVFGCVPAFGRADNALELDRAVVERACPAADPALWRVIERHAEALLAARPEPAESTASRVRRLLSGALGEGVASLAAVAARLRMSERTLQRRLADEGVGFDTLLDELRRELATRYLDDPRIAIAEVAYLLGYSEPSAFHRAFKRWTGTTPAAARRRAA
jgi:AraC-like DNA-binding protein